MARPKGIKKKHEVKKLTPKRLFDKREWLLLGLILVITFIVFAPAITHDFVNWDDDVNVTQNRNVQNLNQESITNMFTTTVIGGYTPLTTLTFAIEHHYFGLNPKAYHTNNIILHLICTALLFFIMKKLGMSLFVTVIVSLLFGIHPMRVESVAWVTERKDMLFTLFYFLAILLYIEFRKTGKHWLYLSSLLFFVLSLLSKIQAVSLPLSLMLIDYFSDKKFHISQIWNKIPFFILSLATGLAGIYFLKQEGSLETGTILPIYQRLFVGSYSLAVYVVKSIIPYEMSAIYPFPSKLSAMHYLSLPAIVLLGYGIWKIRKARFELVFGSLFFLVNVIFVLQVIGAGQGFLADRFTYVGYAGLFFTYAVLSEKLIFGKWKNTVYVIGIIWIVSLGIIAHNRVKVWENSETLFTDVISKYPRVAVAHNNMGRFFREINQYDKAIAAYNIAIEINPESYNTYSNRGKALFDLGRVDEALQDFNRSIELNDNYVEALSNRGAAHAAKNNFQAALPDLNKALDLDPQNLNALSNRSLTFYSMNEFEKAAGDITTYLKFKPDDADMLNLRSLALNQLGRDMEALTDMNRAIELMPSQGVFWQNRSYLFNKMGDMASALRDIRQAQALGLQVNPAYLQMLQQNAQ
jgi:protein O-mannosyl-transferase